MTGGSGITELILSRAWSNDTDERGKRKWELGVRVRDVFNNESTTAKVEIDPSELSDLTAIPESDITITSGHSAFKIKWKNPDAPVLDKVKLKYSDGSNNSEVTMANGSANITQTGTREQEYTLDLGTGVSDATGYSFTVVLVGFFGEAETDKSGTFDLDRTGPSAPVFTSITNSNPSEVTLNYTASVDSDAYSKLQFSRQELDSSDSLIAGTLVYTEIISSDTKFTVTSGKKYRFTLYAYDTPFDANSYARRNATAASATRDLFVAAKPATITSLTEVSAETKHNRITVSWGTYTSWNDDGGTTNRKFQVRRSDTGQTWTAWVDVAHNLTSYEFTDLVYDTSYTFEIKVTNNASFVSATKRSSAISTLRLTNPFLTNNQNLAGNIIPINAGSDNTVEAALNLTWDAISETNWAGGGKPKDDQNKYRTYDILVSNDNGQFWTVFAGIFAYIDLGSNNYADRDNYRITQIYANKGQFKVKMAPGSGSKYGLSDNRSIDTVNESISNLPSDFFTANSNVILILNKSDRSVYSYKTDTGVRSLINEFKLDSTNTNALDLYSNNETIWVLDTVLKKAFAYSASTYVRDSGKDLTLHSSNSNPAGMVSDGTTLWITDTGSTKKLFAYNLSSKARDSSKDVTLNSGNSNPSHLTTDGTTLWVLDTGSTKKVFAYTIATKSRDTSKEFNLNTNNTDPAGLANDGTTLWVADDTDNHIYAYTISSLARNQDNEIDIDITGTLTIMGIHWLSESKVTNFYLDNSGTNSELVVDF